MLITRWRRAFAFRTTYESFAAAEITTVRHVAGGFTAHLARGELRGAGGKVDGNSRVEYVERPLPKPIIALRFAVPHDATVNLIKLRESSSPHQRRQDLAANPSGAVRDDGLLLEVIVFAALEFGNEVSSG